MKNLIPFFIVFSCILIGCSSNPTSSDNQETTEVVIQKGDVKADAQQFTSSIYSKYEAGDVEAVGKIIEEYYDFYKDQPKEKVQAFMSAVKEDWEPLFEKESYNEQKFQDMMMSADKNGNMEKLYHLSL